jgi:hypothetical protein
MVQSCDELIMEIVAETELDWMAQDEDDDEDVDDDKGDATTPHTAAHEVDAEE